MTNYSACPFCNLSKDRVIDEDRHFVVIRDGYPITLAHTLVIPKRHVGSIFELEEEERETLFSVLEAAKERLVDEFHPDSFNIGINDGPEAGQTVPHLHIHLIPRYKGDVEDPRGGVRWVIPEKAKYWDD
jgi:diadenosine tetraphosphate (Ap4A) HIT family hydrolase